MSTVIDNVPSQEKRPSHLPAWLLEMRKNVENSQAALLEVNARLQGVTNTTEALSIKLEARLDCKKNSLPSTRSLSLNTSNEGFGVNHILNQDLKKLNLKSFTLTLLPSDTVNILLSFLNITDVVRFENTSKWIQQYTLKLDFWNQIQGKYCPDLDITDDIIQAKQNIINNEKNILSSINFIRSMKAQRSIARKNAITPQTYSRHASIVNHPLPIFDNTTTSSSNSHSNNNYIMSFTETLNKEFRTTAHRMLQLIYNITNSLLHPLHSILINMGALTVFISLLNNEEGSLQNLSCGIIANLLCWDSISTHQFHMKNEKGKSSTKQLHKPLAEQLEACNGRRLLLSLLTSPRASVNLAGNHQIIQRQLQPSQPAITTTSPTKTTSSSSSQRLYIRRHSTVEDKNVQNPITTATTAAGPGALPAVRRLRVRLTSSVQGIASKEASRALITCFCPEAPVSGISSIGRIATEFTSSLPQSKVFRKQPSLHTDSCCSSASKSTLSSSDEGKLQCQKPNENIFSIDNITEQKTKDKNMGTANTGAGKEGLASPSLNTSQSLNTSSNTSSTSSVDNLNGYELWKFQYYHKSGSLKDTCLVYLYFHSSECESYTDISHPYSQAVDDGYYDRLCGRGEDSIGLFRLLGKIECDSTGWVWYIHKLYVDTSTISENDMDPNPVFGNNYHYNTTSDVPPTGRSFDLQQQQGAGRQQGEGTIGVSEMSSAGGGGAGALGWSRWCRRVYDDVHYEGAMRSHVTHTAYWSPGIGAVDQPFPVPGQLRFSSHCTGTSTACDHDTQENVERDVSMVCPRGLWGIWEACSSGNHFELQKGGVYRALPEYHHM